MVRDDLELLADALVANGVDLPDADSADDVQDANKHRVWSPHEDQALLALYFEHGGRWKSIGACLERRTPDGARNRLKRLLNRPDALVCQLESKASV